MARSKKDSSDVQNESNSRPDDKRYLARFSNEFYIKLNAISIITSISVNELINAACKEYIVRYENDPKIKKDYDLLCSTFSKYQK